MAINESTLVNELVRFSKDQMKVLGKEPAGRYLKKCLELWREQYGDVVYRQVRLQLVQEWDAK